MSAGGAGGPLRGVVMKGVLFIGNYAYGGSRITGAAYSTGTVALTEGSTTVTGTGTAWTAAVADPGRLLVVDGQVFPLDDRTDNTHLELAYPWPKADATGLSYSLKTVAVNGDTDSRAFTAVRTAAGGRLLSGAGATVSASEIDNFSKWTNVDDIRNEVEIPGGVEIVGMATIGDSAIVFTTGGVWVLSDIALDAVDAAGNVQWRLEQVSRDLVALTDDALVEWQGGVLVPAIDGLWMLSLGGPPTLMSKSIGPYWSKMVAQGWRPGVSAVHDGHLLMPVYSATLGIVGQDFMVCRLDRPSQSLAGTVWPWTTWSGQGARGLCVGARHRANTAPVLFGASSVNAVTYRLIQYSVFDPAAAELGVDYDGSVALATYEGRDQATNPGLQNVNLVKRVGARYFLSGTTIEMSWTDASRNAAGAAVGWTVLTGSGAANDGEEVVRWRVNQNMRFLRLRVRCSGAGNFTLYSTEAWIRQSGRL